jgi:flagellar hook-length control protein FliK
MTGPDAARAEPSATSSHAPPASTEPEAVIVEAAPEPVFAEPHGAERSGAASNVSDARWTSAAVRGSPETAAALASEIAKRLEGRNTRFEVALDPAGLGMVNVSIDIGADGRMSAQLAFERPEAAAELRGRSAELQRALEQAGFDLSRGGLSFTGEGGRGGAGGDPSRQHNARAQAFQHALLSAEAADTLPAQPLRLRDRAGLDVRI